MAETETEKGSPAKPARKPPKRKQVEAHIRSMFDALARRDAEAIGEHWRDDGVDEIVPIGVFRGRREIVDFFRELFAAVPDLETSLTRVVTSDRLAAAEWRVVGNFTGAPFLDVDPTGRRIELRGFDMFEVEDGQIVGNTAYYDGAAWARQVGMLPAKDSGAERAITSAFNTVTKLRKAVAERASGE
jgi:steroid delta-isomerase-like uncharacterized protein